MNHNVIELIALSKVINIEETIFHQTTSIENCINLAICKYLETFALIVDDDMSFTSSCSSRDIIIMDCCTSTTQ